MEEIRRLFPAIEKGFSEWLKHNPGKLCLQYDTTEHLACQMRGKFVPWESWFVHLDAARQIMYADLLSDKPEKSEREKYLLSQSVLTVCLLKNTDSNTASVLILPLSHDCLQIVIEANTAVKVGTHEHTQSLSISHPDSSSFTTDIVVLVWQIFASPPSLVRSF